MYLWLLGHRERVVALLAASTLAVPLGVLAAVNSSDLKVCQISGQPFCSATNTIRSIFNIIVTVAGVAFVVLFLLGGIQYLGQAGNDEGTKKARQLMLDAVIGLGIVVVAWAVGTYVLQVLGLSNKNQINLDPSTLGQ